MTDAETEILELITHIETYVDQTNLVILNERQRKVIVDILDGYTASRASSFTSSPPPLIAPHNSGERLPSSDAAKSGGDTMHDRLSLAKSIEARDKRMLDTKDAGFIQRLHRHELPVVIGALKSSPRESYFAGSDAAFHQVANDLEAAGILDWARHYRGRARAPTVPPHHGEPHG